MKAALSGSRLTFHPGGDPQPADSLSDNDSEESSDQEVQIILRNHQASILLHGVAYSSRPHFPLNLVGQFTPVQRMNRVRDCCLRKSAMDTQRNQVLPPEQTMRSNSARPHLTEARQGSEGMIARELTEQRPGSSHSMATEFGEPRNTRNTRKLISANCSSAWSAFSAVGVSPVASSSVHDPLHLKFRVMAEVDQ